jgi:hypothetical protein
MTEGKVVNEWIEEAVKQQGLESGRRYLIRLLQRRFPSQVAPEVIDTINAQPSLPMLEGWFDQACQVTSLADFVRKPRA